ncbi:MAG: class I SAM-dependent methyltransferase [Magnetovibrio sp.]|nr:class I SAM-dependent methyltransferase [Magnetovibrio sp.]
MLNPQPDDETLAKVYDESYFIGSDNLELFNQGNDLKRGTAHLQLDDIATYLGQTGKPNSHTKMLEIGCGLGNFLLSAQQRGYDVHGIDVSQSAVDQANKALGENRAQAGFLENLNLTPGSYDIVVLADVIEHVRDPKAFLELVRTLLRPGGILFVAVPSLDSLSARLMGRYWVEYKLEHLFYFNRKTLTQLLGTNGFEKIKIRPGHKMLSLDYIVGHFVQFPVPVLTTIMKLIKWIVPKRLCTQPIRIVASGINAIARVPDQVMDKTHSD